ncbi:cbb3-type cytochrome c oxidase subunit 3 [Parasedimentitalea maritima]|uniref:Cbb3-type cytochrome c oxidase subunit 3 n=1 Tax=Parasedimentitalea maritima TaxID=2578117 RepID=A0A5R8ZRU4_9RHOB|nr:cbb3-type cytochrome c oxidase subunit 3 [Zongyanglinia marina]KAE9632575.1 CcoQ/FixQ family Cbb3-type cytochrome c oxidase assembly chaperone [Zongyanglinia marina]TLP69082.1 cbb3-type cytochrome c oxidase subunit 3 [Zongyanglinia marina]
MEIYTLLREFADSWMLLFLFVVFVTVILWAFRPGSTKVYQDVANIPFRHVDAPAPQSGVDTPAASKEART